MKKKHCKELKKKYERIKISVILVSEIPFVSFCLTRSMTNTYHIHKHTKHIYNTHTLTFFAFAFLRKEKTTVAIRWNRYDASTAYIFKLELHTVYKICFV